MATAIRILNLALLGAFFDVALRDFGLFLGALALGKLAAVYEPDAHRPSR